MKTTLLNCDSFSISVAKSTKSNVKEVLLKEAEFQELPKLSIKGVTFAIEPFESPKSHNACISTYQRDCELLTAKRVKKPVVLINKEELPALAPQKQPKMLKIEPRKVLPDVVLYRWHSGFRHNQGRYAKVIVLKLELYYPDDLHDILVTRDLSLTLKSTNLTLHTKGRVLNHKCLVEFVIFENVTQDTLFHLIMKCLFDASDLEEFIIDLEPYKPNVWMKHEFDKMKLNLNNKGIC